MPALAAPKSADLGNELDRYLNTDIEHVKDPVAWWYEHRESFPHLLCMALDYLTIPGKSDISLSHQGLF